VKIKQTEHGNMCEVRLKDRRIQVYRLHDKSWAVAFVRPTKACAGCGEDHSASHKTYAGCRGRTMITGMRMSREAMMAFCDAVSTLLEFEMGGVQV
jgi:hypothetical protein